MRVWPKPAGAGPAVSRAPVGSNCGVESGPDTFAKRDDAWLLTRLKEPGWGGGPINNYCLWFHVCEHISHHAGQIDFLMKRLPGARPDGAAGGRNFQGSGSSISPSAAPSNQTVNLFSGLLVHHIRKGLADGITQGGAGFMESKKKGADSVLRPRSSGPRIACEGDMHSRNRREKRLTKRRARNRTPP